MLPREMVILMAIAVNKDASRKLLSHQMDVMSPYIGYLYDSLVYRGFLKGNSIKGYQLTSDGGKILSNFLHENEKKVKDLIERLEFLGINYSNEVDKLGKEVIRVK